MTNIVITYQIPICKVFMFTDTLDRDRCYNASLGYQNYLGHVNTTYSGKQCQRWDVDYPHVRDLSGITFVEPDLASVENYCRKVDISPFFWCYTMDPNQRWEPCSIWKCFENNGTSYLKQFFLSLHVVSHISSIPTTTFIQ